MLHEDEGEEGAYSSMATHFLFSRAHDSVPALSSGRPFSERHEARESAPGGSAHGSPRLKRWPRPRAGRRYRSSPAQERVSGRQVEAVQRVPPLPPGAPHPRSPRGLRPPGRGCPEAPRGPRGAALTDQSATSSRKSPLCSCNCTEGALFGEARLLPCHSR